ncbi:MAG: helix-turn-helix domain-containing protein [Phycisphaeraceae bacterium]|nr:helix-turn-helix domain-containing protein [Phycisphaeraceae bacterium]
MTTAESPHRAVELSPVMAAVGIAHNGFKVILKNGSDQWLLALMLNGYLRFHHPQGFLLAAPGDVVAIEPGTPHRYGVEDGGPTLAMFASFHARPHWLEWLNWPEVSPGLLHLRIEDAAILRRVRSSFRRATKLIDIQNPLREDLTLNALEQVLMWCYMAHPKNPGTRLDPRIRLAVEYLSTNLEKPISVSDLAEVCQVSSSHLYPMFRSQLGMTPQKFLEQQRMNRAMKLLRMTNDSIQAVSVAVGFVDPFHFSTRFKKYVGQSPREYRRGADREPTES